MTFMDRGKYESQIWGEEMKEFKVRAVVFRCP
jgi:hypothetical protein